MKRILVTGGAGFIGSHLCEYLLQKGNEVICVDNFFTGQKRNILHLMKNPYFEIIRHDITWPLYVEVDQIYNLASPAAPIHYQKDPIQTTKTNVLGSIQMLGLAKRLKIPILLTSTSEIYGDPREHPQKETYRGNVSTTSSRACYDEAKRCVETLFMDYWRQNKVKIKIIRVFNTYGPRLALNDGRVVSNFIIQALQNKPITIYGKGQQTRSFCYIDDLVHGLYKMMQTDDHITGPINLGNPEEFTILKLAKLVIKLTKTKSKIVYKPLPQDDPKQRRPDVSLAKRILDWKPTIPLKKGLEKSIPYFRKALKENKNE
jgi:UDP-glucuronate decarboxylase